MSETTFPCLIGGEVTISEKEMMTEKSMADHSMVDMTMTFDACDDLEGFLTVEDKLRTFDSNTIIQEITLNGITVRTCEADFDRLTLSSFMDVATEEVFSGVINGSLFMHCEGEVVDCTWRDVSLFDKEALERGCR
jgi:hypothetical protein